VCVARRGWLEKGDVFNTQSLAEVTKTFEAKANQCNVLPWKGETLKENDKLTSESLAVLIIDALVDAKIVAKEDVERAIEIATEEIEARKAACDY
jgi:hypothetical protein